MEFFDSLLNLYNTNYEVKDTIQAIGLTIAFICIPELIGNHDSVESLIFPQYTGIHFNGDFKRPDSIESTLTRIIAILMLIGLFIVEFVFDNK